MMVLGLDTSGTKASVAIVRDGCVLYQCECHRSLSHSDMLAPLIQDSFRYAAEPLSALACAGIAVGPGSFTGLRIGIGFLMGLCLPHGIPVIPLSSLELLAFSAGCTATPVRPIINAQRGEVFTALYAHTETGWRNLEEERLVPAGDIDLQEPVLRLFSGSKSALPQNSCLQTESWNTAGAAALLAEERRKTAIPAADLRARYLRLPAAQEKAAAKPAAG